MKTWYKIVNKKKRCFMKYKFEEPTDNLRWLEEFTDFMVGNVYHEKTEDIVKITIVPKSGIYIELKNIVDGPTVNIRDKKIK